MQRTRAEFVQTVLPQRQGQSAAPEERALTQIHSTEPLQRENFSSCLRLLHRLHPPPSFSLPLYPFCSACTAHILSFHPATFIILSSLDHSSPPLSLPLFSLYLSLALTSLQHCSVGEDASTHFLSYLQGVYLEPNGFILSR